MKGNILDNNKLQKENPFRVPDGYFQKVQQEVMAKLPEQEPVIKVKTSRRQLFLRLVITVAASICVAVFGAVAFVDYFNNEDNARAVNVKTVHSSEDDDSEYIMMDNADIYNYLAEL